VFIIRIDNPIRYHRYLLSDPFFCCYATFALPSLCPDPLCYQQHGKCKTFAINYRLAPQHPFPAALVDALAAYLYITNPPENAGFKPVDVAQLVMAGDSAGGGLVLATALAIRDLNLPAAAGVIALSPW
jgi:hypothetical protein